MNDSAWIDDGYNDTRHIVAVPGLYPAATIDFRPMTAEDFAAFSHRTRQMQADATRKEVAKEIAKRLQGWNVTKRDGSVVEYTDANLLKLRPAFFTRLESIVFGFDPGDQEQREADLKN